MSSSSLLTNEDVLQQDVPWETFKTAKMINAREYELIKRFDKSTDTAKASALEEASAAVFQAFFSVLRNVHQEEVVRYALALIDEMVTMEPARAKDMHEAGSSQQGSTPTPITVLSRLLSRSDWFTQEKSAKLLALAISTAPTVDDAIIMQFMDWLTSQLRQPSQGEASLEVASGALAGLLRLRQVRKEAAKRIHLLKSTITNTLSSTAPQRSQILYNATLCLWQLTFEASAAKEMQGSGVIKVLVDLLKEGNKEKVMRISLMTLSQLSADGDEAALAQMVEAGLPRLVRIRSAQSWADEDIPVLLETMDGRLTTSVVDLSKFEKYRQEVLSGALEWTPMHTSVAFWQENVAAMEEKDFQIIRCLIKVLETSRDAKALAIACSDLGMFADVHQHGRFIVNDLGGKSRVMALMANADADVQKNALICVQRLMLGRDKLDFLRRPEALASA